MAPPRRQRLSLFSLGGVIQRCWPGEPPLLSWIAAASLLMIAAFADPVKRGGFIDFIMVGLALYELMIGTLETA